MTIKRAPNRTRRGTHVCCCETHYGSYCGQFPSTFMVERGHYIMKHSKELPYSWDKIVIEKRFVTMVRSMNRFQKW